ncbi:MAG TPA: DUF2510 domain-containing protein [Mycobacteriales bacterium]|nr:DUF2510 domain-containing protein [Mycobacteriales bacterium]
MGADNATVSRPPAAVDDTGRLLPPPGWYPNPDGTPSLRWWSGLAWTADVQRYAPARSTSDLIARVIIALAIAFLAVMLIVGGLITASNP